MPLRRNQLPNLSAAARGKAVTVPKRATPKTIQATVQTATRTKPDPQYEPWHRITRCDVRHHRPAYAAYRIPTSDSQGELLALRLALREAPLTAAKQKFPVAPWPPSCEPKVLPANARSRPRFSSATLRVLRRRLSNGRP